jgi:putative transposase
LLGAAGGLAKLEQLIARGLLMPKETLGCPWEVGFPKAIRVDQGTEFVSRDLDLWAYRRGVTLDFSRPGKPTDNAFIESFNGKFRAECLNAHWFMSLDDARRKCEAWRRDYNEERPHSAIGNKAPIELIDRSVAYGPRWPKLAGKSPAAWSKDGEQSSQP